MDHDTHQTTNLFCPYCLIRLTAVKQTGFMFCSSANPFNCDYEVLPGGRPPLDLAATQAEIIDRWRACVARNERTIKELQELNAELENNIRNPPPPE